jgi:purine-binding chemotaxis protein CheW
MNELLLIVTIAGQRLALRAADVQSVIEVGSLTPVPRAPRHVAGLSALRSRVLTAIDCRRCVGLTEDADTAPAAYAVVVEHDGHSYALLVEAVDDVTTSVSDIEVVRAPLGQGWENMTQGMMETAEGPLLLVDIGAMIAGPDEARVAA